MNPEKLEFDREEMRRLGYRAVDMVVEHLATLDQQHIGHRATRPDLMAVFDEAPPRQGRSADDVFALMQRHVFPNALCIQHPRFFGFVPGPSNYAAVLAELLSTGHNIFAGNWLSGSSASAMELVVTGWLRDMCGLAPTAEGLFVSGGSVANLTGIVVARHVKLDDDLNGAVAYLSDQTHSSVERALRIAGLRPHQVRKIPANDRFQMPLRDLIAAVASDRAAGLRPFCVIANGGTINTGAVDPLTDMARYCQAEDLWLHMDGAFGAAAAVCARGREALRGMELVDSLSIDPHKWLFQPYETGCVFVREGHLLKDTFRIMPEYLRDVHRGMEEVHFCDRGIQLTRGYRSLKVWLTFQLFGADAIERAVEKGFEQAEYAGRLLHQMPDWEVVTEPTMATVTFRHKRLDDERYHDIVSRLIETGYAFLISTRIRGRAVLRMCCINPRSSESDIASTLDHVDRIAREFSPA